MSIICTLPTKRAEINTEEHHLSLVEPTEVITLQTRSILEVLLCSIQCTKGDMRAASEI